MEESWFETLRRYREESGVSLQEMALRTRIGIRHIQALETGDLTLISSPAFVRGFIRSICAELRKDPSPIVLALNSSLAPPPMPGAEAEAENGQRKMATPLVLSGIVLVLLVTGAILLRGRRLAVEPATSTVAEDAVSAAITAEPYMEEPPAVTAPLETAEAASKTEAQILPELNLTITAVERTWLRYTPDEGIAQEATLTPGESISVKAASTVSLFIGNAGGVLFDLNGKAFGPPGEQGQVISNYIISRDNL